MAFATPPTCQTASIESQRRMTNLRTVFFWIARLEGVSLLLLFFVAMPLKYGAGWEHATMVPGWAHGVLFMAYMAGLVALGARERWAPPEFALGFIASLVPFGTFLFERRLETGAPQT